MMRMTTATAATATATAVSLLWTRLVLVALLLVVDTSLAQGEVVHLKEGDVVPNVTFFTRTRTTVVNPPEFEWKQRNSLDDYFFNKRVVLFALPGAFTPTCSAAHLPGYEDAYLDMTRSNNLGVDEVYCTFFSRHCWKNALNFAVTDHLSFFSLWFYSFSSSLTLSLPTTTTIFPTSIGLSVNDAFVMRQWGLHQGLTEDMTPGSLGGFKKVKLIPDGAGAFTSGMGMLVPWDSERGFGNRSWRYSMVRIVHVYIISFMQRMETCCKGDDDSSVEAMLHSLLTIQCVFFRVHPVIFFCRWWTMVRDRKMKNMMFLPQGVCYIF
jgi:thioredoxin-dependent peroxiredoxin